jgi:hypothetical protein
LVPFPFTGQTTVEKGLALRKLESITDSDRAALNKGLQSILGE